MTAALAQCLNQKHILKFHCIYFNLIYLFNCIVFYFILTARKQFKVYLFYQEVFEIIYLVVSGDKMQGGSILYESRGRLIL